MLACACCGKLILPEHGAVYRQSTREWIGWHAAFASPGEISCFTSDPLALAEWEALREEVSTRGRNRIGSPYWV